MMAEQSPSQNQVDNKYVTQSHLDKKAISEQISEQQRLIASLTARKQSKKKDANTLDEGEEYKTVRESKSYSDFRWKLNMERDGSFLHRW
jgi:hypothetical protein